jgi:hypothetical protein
MGELPETENGNKYILVVSDYFTKWTECFAMPNMEARTVVKIIVEEVIVRFGVPCFIQRDQGRFYGCPQDVLVIPKPTYLQVSFYWN